MRPIQTRAAIIVRKLNTGVLTSIAFAMVFSGYPAGFAIAAVGDGTTMSADSAASSSNDIKSGSLSTTIPDSELTVEDVTIEGNRLVPSEDILGVVKTRRGDHFDRDQVMRDLKAVNSMGYFDDRSLQAVPEMGGNGVLLKIRVQENAPVTQFGFQGNSVLSSEDLSKLFSDQLGKPQNLSQLSQSIDKVEQAYHEKGFMLARVVDVKDDPDGSVSIKVDEGQLGDIKITGNKKTKDFIIRNAIKLKPGMVYNERTLTADLRKLYGNGYFQDVRRSLSPDPEHPDKYTLKVEVDEKRTGSVGLGGGVDTINGPFGSFNIADQNFRGRGQIVSFSTQMGSGMMNNVTNGLNNGGNNFLPTGVKNYSLEANFVEPNIRGTNTSLGLSGFARNNASMLVDDSAQRTLGASMTFSRALGNKWNGSLSLSGERTSLKDYGLGGLIVGSNGTPGLLTQRALLTGKAYDMASAQQYAQGIRNQQLKGGLYATFSPTLYYDTRNSNWDPTKGSFAKISGGPSIGLSGSSFMKAGVSYSKFKQITKGTTLAFNTQAGQAIGGVPQFAQYRLGGFNGMRGYRMFSDLGSGSGMLMSSLELRHRLPLPKGDKHGAGGMILNYVDKNVRGVAFTDFGAVTGNSATNSLYNRSAMGASIGVGLRLNVPMLGLVRLDYGLPMLSSALGRFTPRFTVGFGDKF